MNLLDTHNEINLRDSVLALKNTIAEYCLMCVQTIEYEYLCETHCEAQFICMNWNFTGQQLNHAHFPPNAVPRTTWR